MSKKISDVYRSNYLKAADLKGRDITVTVAGAEWQDFKDAEKLELSFNETKRTLLLNQTNALTIAAMHGQDPDGWKGKRITLYPTTVAFNGSVVAAIRVRPEPPKTTASETTDDIIDSIESDKLDVAF